VLASDAGPGAVIRATVLLAVQAAAGGLYATRQAAGVVVLEKETVTGPLTKRIKYGNPTALDAREATFSQVERLLAPLLRSLGFPLATVRV
jgi:hypothetical protein